MVEFLTDLHYPRNPDPPQVFLYHAQQLENSIVTLRSAVAGSGSSTRAAVQEAVQYTSHLLAHIVASSGNVSYPEIDLLRRYHHDAFSLTDEVSSVFRTVEADARFLETIPGFLLDAKAMSGGSEDLARQMVSCVHGMCTAIAAVDRVEEPSESSSIASYLDLLRSMVVDS